MVAVNLAELRERIERAGGDPDAVTVVAVTKEQPVEAIDAALAAGLTDLGENRPEALAERAPRAPHARWHLLGQIQRRKVAAVAPHVALWQSVDRPEAGAAIAKHAPGADVLVQINLTDDPQRGGTSFEDAPALVADLAADGLNVRGLMAVGPLGGPDAARPGFTQLVRTADRLGLPVRSIGMSDDIEVAIACGSTMVRVGSKLFGPRPRSRDARHLDLRT
jgi:pyridoxal phosphate enzyme (YggS family)